MRVFPRCAAQCVYIYIYICHIYIDVQTRISCFDWAINASITNPYANRRVRKSSWLVESSPNSSQQSAPYSGFPYVFQFFSHFPLTKRTCFFPQSSGRLSSHCSSCLAFSSPNYLGWVCNMLKHVETTT